MLTQAILPRPGIGEAWALGPSRHSLSAITSAAGALVSCGAAEAGGGRGCPCCRRSASRAVIRELDAHEASFVRGGSCPAAQV